MAHPVEQRDLRPADGRTLRAYDAGGGPAAALVWHHGSPQSGAPLPPVLEAAAQRGVRLVSYGRPSYGGSTPLPGRDIASTAGDVAQVADACGRPHRLVVGRLRAGLAVLLCR
jgi:pimeloyl-ACP methyl ester carboxylesterase